MTIQPNRMMDLVADDPEVRQAAKSLALLAIERAQFLMLYGNDDIQMKLITAMTPTFRKAAMAMEDDNAAEAARQTAFVTLVQAMESDGSTDGD